MRPSAARNRRPSNDRLIHLELFTDFFNKIGQTLHFCGVLVVSAFHPIVFSNSGSGCQALYDHPCRAHCSLRGRDVPSA